MKVPTFNSFPGQSYEEADENVQDEQQENQNITENIEEETFVGCCFEANDLSLYGMPIFSGEFAVPQEFITPTQEISYSNILNASQPIGSSEVPTVEEYLAQQSIDIDENTNPSPAKIDFVRRFRYIESHFQDESHLLNLMNLSYLRSLEYHMIVNPVWRLIATFENPSKRERLEKKLSLCRSNLRWAVIEAVSIAYRDYTNMVMATEDSETFQNDLPQSGHWIPSLVRLSSFESYQNERSWADDLQGEYNRWHQEAALLDKQRPLQGLEVRREEGEMEIEGVVTGPIVIPHQIRLRNDEEDEDFSDQMPNPKRKKFYEEYPHQRRNLWQAANYEE